jgi:hypothetical protein
LIALDAIGAEGAEAIMRSVVQAAQNGDLRAAEIILRRLWPERKGRPIMVDIPPIRSAADLPIAVGAVTEAVAAGELSAGCASTIWMVVSDDLGEMCRRG